MSGPYSLLRSSYLKTFKDIFSYCIGNIKVYIGVINNPENQIFYPKFYRDLSFIFDIGNFFLKLLMTNFSLVIIFFFYRKYTDKRVKLEEEEKKKNPQVEEINNEMALN